MLPCDFCKIFQNGYTAPMCGCFWSLCYTGHARKTFAKKFFVLCLLYQYDYWIKTKKFRNKIKRKGGLYQKHCIQKRLVWAEFSYFSWYHGCRSAFFSLNYLKSWACNNIMILSVRPCAAEYIQRTCSIIVHDFFLGKACFLYRLASLRFFIIDPPKLYVQI